MSRVAVLLGLALRLSGHAVRLGARAGLDLRGTALGSLYDRAHLVGRDAGEPSDAGLAGALALRLSALELVDGLGDLSQVAVHLFGVVAPSRLREVCALYLVSLEVQLDPLRGLPGCLRASD